MVVRLHRLERLDLLRLVSGAYLMRGPAQYSRATALPQEFCDSMKLMSVL